MAKKKTGGVETAGESGEAKAGPYVVLARKYRPQSFDDLIGQDAMVRTLRNSFASGRIAQGYMLTGVRGVGKTTTARILARALNYETDTVNAPTVDMPELGRHCAGIMESRHPDVIEMDAASNTGVDNMREIIDNVRYMPIMARTKVFIIDEVHMLSKGAFNALLKTLEEPPEHVKFIFATTEVRKVPVTVLSRCQRFDLRRVETTLMAEHLRKIAANEGAKADTDALVMIARAAEGSVRDGLSILDQAIVTGSGHVTTSVVRSMLGLADRDRIFDLMEHVVRGDAAAALKGLDALFQDGAEPVQVLSDLAEVSHIVSRVKVVGPEPGSEALPAEEKKRAAALAGRLSLPLLARVWQMLVKGMEDAARSPDPRAAADMVLIRIAYTADLPSPDEIIKVLGGDGPGRGSGTPPNTGAERRDGRPPLNVVESAPTGLGSVGEASLSDAAPEDLGDDAAPLDEEGADQGDAIATVASGATAIADPRSFADVVALAGARRDARLKVHLEEHVSLVKFDAVAGSIDLFLLPGAPAELANELREKLNRWTGRRWMVVLSKVAGERSIGEVQRERKAAEIARLKAHPAVAAIFEAFPDAKIAEVRPIATRDDDETGTG